MKPILLVLLSSLFFLAGCAEPSTNPNPRRTFNAESGNYEGPSPLPGSKSPSTYR